MGYWDPGYDRDLSRYKTLISLQIAFGLGGEECEELEELLDRIPDLDRQVVSLEVARKFEFSRGFIAVSIPDRRHL